MEASKPYPLSPQHEAAMKHVKRRLSNEKAEKIESILNNIDQQIFTNLSPHTTPEHPGAVFPFTKVVINSHEPDTNADENRQIVPKKKIIEIDVSGFATPPGGHPLTPETFYDRVFSHMLDAKSPTEITIAKLGQPSGLGGKTTSELNKNKKEHGFTFEAALLAKTAKELLPEDEEEKKNTTVIFHGTSMGAIKALEAALKFKPEVAKEVHLLNPPRLPGLPTEYQPNSAQIIFGYALEGIFRKRLELLKDEIITPEYTNDLKKIFAEKGMDSRDSLKQRLKKENTIFLNVRNIMKNKVHLQEAYDFPIRVRAGALDPINFSFRGWAKAMLNEPVTNGTVTVDFVMATHSVNNYQVDKWSQALDNISPQPPYPGVLEQQPNKQFNNGDKFLAGSIS